MGTTSIGNTNIAPTPNNVVATVAPVDQVSLTKEAVRGIIQEILKEEVIRIQQESAPMASQDSAKDYLMFAIGSVLTPEEQKWLAKKDRVKKVNDVMARFILTDDGKLSVSTFIDFFRKVEGGENED
jgi:hypothetical protein